MIFWVPVHVLGDDLEVDDIYQISFLLVQGHKFLKTKIITRKNNKQKVVFVFEDSAEETLKKYWNSEIYAYKKNLIYIRDKIRKIKEDTQWVKKRKT